MKPVYDETVYTGLYHGIYRPLSETAGPGSCTHGTVMVWCHQEQAINWVNVDQVPGIIMCICPANKRWHCTVTQSLIGWVHIQNDLWVLQHYLASSKASKLIDQSHRYGRHQAACREPAGSYDKTTRTAICFEHKTQYLLIHAPYTRIVVFWHISNISPMISQSQISCNTPTFYIAAIFVKYCYTIGSWLL